LATKHHQLSADEDVNYFTDADLSILGQDWGTYLDYAKKIRKEYRLYPDLAYKPGRKKVLQHFFEMESIFKTSGFRERYEAAARRNLQQELSIL
jgi:predicted metal-dependent HD superfamily phosphohydrolase